MNPLRKKLVLIPRRDFAQNPRRDFAQNLAISICVHFAQFGGKSHKYQC